MTAKATQGPRLWESGGDGACWVCASEFRLGMCPHGATTGSTESSHGFNPGGTDLEARLVHGAGCGECHDFLRQMSADRCCEWHYARKYGVPGWNAYRARRAELLGLSDEP